MKQLLFSEQFTPRHDERNTALLVATLCTTLPKETALTL